MGPRFFKRGEKILTRRPTYYTVASMGPRFFKRGECNYAPRTRTPANSFNGATLLQAWRVHHAGFQPFVQFRLQWGHASSSVESISALERLQAHGRASMGPRFFKRGECIQAIPFDHPAKASMGPRFFKRGERLLGGHREIRPHASMGPRFFKRGESVDEPLDTIASRDASMGPRFFKRGEGRDAGDDRVRFFASMGPRFFKRGETTPARVTRQSRYRFNGATLLQAWRVHPQRQLIAIPLRFNGATLLQAWRVSLHWLSTWRAIPLQWGHASSSVESTDTSRLTFWTKTASMGPRFFKRGE